MTKEEARAEIARLNKISEAVSPDFLRLQKILTIISDKIKYCQGVIDDKPVKTSEEAIADAEKEFVKPEPAPAPDPPKDEPLTPPAT